VPSISKPPPPIAIGITTFAPRFDAYFVPLIRRLRDLAGDWEIIVAVNGEHQRPFDETYRRRLLGFLAEQPQVMPVLFPRFRSLSKLWNTLLIHASHDHVLILNDDVMVTRRDFLGRVRQALTQNHGRSFTINSSWSHFVANRDEIDRLGYFDERLLGIGEEDGDMSWRYQECFGRPVKTFRIKGIENYAEETMAQRPVNIQCRQGSKYSRFNRRFMFEQKYQRDPNGFQGLFDHPVVLRDPGRPQYPHERFFREHCHEL
jgi:hypothetical protein